MHRFYKVYDEEKYKNFFKPTISYLCDKTLLLSSIRDKCGSEDT